MSEVSCLIVVGEKSGEEHSLSFLPELIKKNPHIKFFGVGGKDLKNLGVEILFDYHNFSSIGFGFDVLKKIPYYMNIMNQLCSEVQKRKCKTAILVDYQGFNLKIGEKLKHLGVNVLHFVAPQAWVWKENRVESIKKNVHTLFSIVPFEKKWFGDRGVKRIVGIKHPLLIRYENLIDNLPKRHFPKNEIKLLLLPGSRNFEVKNLLPRFIEAAIRLKKKKNIKIHIVQSETVNSGIYEMYSDLFDKVYQSEQLTDALIEADVCFASSGTVTLACGLFNLPTFVSYYFSPINEFIGRHIIKYTWFLSLTNILHNKFVFPEFVQGDIHPGILSEKAFALLNNEEKYLNLVEELKKTKDYIIGDPVNIADYMAQVING